MYSEQEFGQIENELVSGRLACTSSKLQNLNHNSKKEFKKSPDDTAVQKYQKQILKQ